ncbi:MAG: AEC family transporter, partial [Chitinispirillales bacterium]|nr:AEC family transporter [Chitinispirillales bacterium]
MDSSRVLEILRITVPVFVMMGIGNLLSRTGKMTGEHQSFLNWIVYYICLPVLIFAGLVGQPFRSLFNTDLIFSTLLALLAVFLIFAIGCALFRVNGKFAVVMIYCAYWANVAYIGFPLSASAFGERGLRYAAIVNAISMPVFVIAAFIMISFYSEKRPNRFLISLKDALVNPIILASVIGLIAAFAADILLL